jgi:hypothetical protein
MSYPRFLAHWPAEDIRELLFQRGIDVYDEGILLAEVGSTAHGMSVADQDDLDLTLVRFEPWEEFVNGPSQRQSMMVRTQPEGARSGPGDLDINVYTLRKYVNLLAKGNPSILGAAYSPLKWHDPDRALNWGRLYESTTSKAAGNAYLGYMKQQLERWLGKRGQKNVNRPELVEKYGYDTKYAGHIIRLGIQGQQYMKDGRLKLPLEPEDAKTIKAVRRGEMDQKTALKLAFHLEEGLFRAVKDSPLPEKPDMNEVHRWLASAYGVEYSPWK